MDQKLDGLRQGEKLSPMSPPRAAPVPWARRAPQADQPPAALCSPKAAPSSALCIPWESSDPDPLSTESPQLHLLPSAANSLEYGGTHGAGGQRYTFWSILDLQKDFVCRF